MLNLTHNTAIVVVPPTEAWAPIQAIRARHDRKVRRWMPHMTLVYPFWPVTEFKAATERLTPVCQMLAGFEVELAEFSTFRHRGDNYTMWLRPEPEVALVELHRRLWLALFGPSLPTPQQPAFQPHLSVGQVRGKAAMSRLVEDLYGAWQPLRFQVAGISLLWRGEPPNDVFRVGAAVPLSVADR